MKKNWILVVLFAILKTAALASAADCPERTGHWPYGPTHAVAVYGDYVFYGAGTTVRVADVSVPSSPIVVGEVRLEKQVLSIDVSGDSAFVAASERGLVALDLSDPAALSVVDEVGGMDIASEVVVEGDVAWVAAGGSGLIAVDVSDPNDLQLLATYEEDLNFLRGLAISGNLAVAISPYGDLYTFDISNPASPQRDGWLGLDRLYGVDLHGNYAYVADCSEGVRVVDISNPLSPTLVTTITEGYDYYLDVLAVDDLLLVSHRNSGLLVVDVTDPASPVALDTVDTPGEAYTVAYENGLAYLADNWKGVAIVDLADPSDLTVVGSLAGEGIPDELTASGSLAVATSVGDLLFFDISDPTDPTVLSSFDPADYTEDLVLADGNLYFVTYNDALTILDVSDPAEPYVVGKLEIDSVSRLAVDAGLAVTAGSDLISVIDVTNPSDPQELGNLEIDYSPGGLLLTGSTAYLSDYRSGLHVIDLSDPADPREVTLVEMSGADHILDAVGDLLLVGDQGEGLRIFDISDPVSPNELGVFSGTRYFSGVAAIGNVVGLASIYDGFFVIDITDPANPVQLGVHPMAKESEADAEATGSLVLVTEREAGLELFSLNDCMSEPPTADFTWAPAIPHTNELVHLTDQSTGPVSAWNWSFGDTSGSTQQAPEHAWTEPGSYEVSLQISGPNGTDSVTKTVTVAGGPAGGPPIATAQAHTYVILAAAHIGGAAGTTWVTDAVLHNPGETAAAAQLYFMERDQDNTGASAYEIHIPAGASVELQDIVAELFRESNASGAIMVGSDQALEVTSRTYNDVAGTTYGQFVPGVAVDQATGPEESMRLIQLTRNAEFRTNIGFANASSSELNVTVDLYRSSGAEILTRSYTIDPYGYSQANDILDEDEGDAYALVRSNTPGARYFTYASVVDNHSGDPVLVRPVQAVSSGTPVYVPAAAHLAGAAGTNWRTDLEIHNSGSASASYVIDLLQRDQPNPSPVQQSFSIRAGRSVRSRDVLQSVFGFSGAAALRVTPSTGSIMVTSRTYNDVAGGTYGQFVAGYPVSTTITNGDEGRLLQLAYSPSSSSGFRTNIGFANATGKTTQVQVALFGASGELLGAVPVTLRAWEHRQISNIYAQVTGSAITGGYAVVTTDTSGAAFFAYASVVDNRSGDPIYVPARFGSE